MLIQTFKWYFYKYFKNDLFYNTPLINKFLHFMIIFLKNFYLIYYLLKILFFYFYFFMIFTSLKLYKN